MDLALEYLFKVFLPHLSGTIVPIIPAYDCAVTLAELSPTFPIWYNFLLLLFLGG